MHQWLVDDQLSVIHPCVLWDSPLDMRFVQDHIVGDFFSSDHPELLPGVSSVEAL